MTTFEDIKKYLPQYLSADQTKNLYEELKQFPDNIDGRMYSAVLNNEKNIFQGDGYEDMLLINLPDKDVKLGRGMVLSNTCDVDTSNERITVNRLNYAPILKLGKYEKMLGMLVSRGERTVESIQAHISDIRKQRVSNIFYLPENQKLNGESIVFLDRVNNLPSDYISTPEIPGKRLFSLSDFGFYLFLFKLSIHFTRVQERVIRG